jgi:hypothetical protein
MNLTIKGNTQLIENILIIPITDKKAVMSFINEQSTEKEYSLEIKQIRQKRTLSQNDYAWLIMARMANMQRTSKEEIYIKMLELYGQRETELFEMIPAAYQAFRRATENHCYIVDNQGNKYIVAILIGSSEYDTKAMSILIDGIISDAEGMGVDTTLPRDRALLAV